MDPYDDGMILRNQAICNECGEHIMSAYRHSFVTCSCGNLAVDGGLDYLRRSVKHGWDSETETSISIPARVDKDLARQLLLTVIGLSEFEEPVSVPEARVAMEAASEGKHWFLSPGDDADTKELLDLAVRYGIAKRTHISGQATYSTDRLVAPWPE